LLIPILIQEEKKRKTKGTERKKGKRFERLVLISTLQKKWRRDGKEFSSLPL